MELSFMEFRRNGNLFLTESGITPQSVEAGCIDNTDKVTSITFVYSTGETEQNDILYKQIIQMGLSTEVAKYLSTKPPKYISKTYFVGDVVPGNTLVTPSHPLYNCQCAVTYHEDKTISYVIGLTPDKNWHPVPTIEILRKIYKSTTGYNLVSNNKKHIRKK